MGLNEIFSNTHQDRTFIVIGGEDYVCETVNGYFRDWWTVICCFVDVGLVATAQPAVCQQFVTNQVTMLALRCLLDDCKYVILLAFPANTSSRILSISSVIVLNAFCQVQNAGAQTGDGTFTGPLSKTGVNCLHETTLWTNDDRFQKLIFRKLPESKNNGTPTRGGRFYWPFSSFQKRVSHPSCWLQELISFPNIHFEKKVTLPSFFCQETVIKVLVSLSSCPILH